MDPSVTLATAHLSIVDELDRASIEEHKKTHEAQQQNEDEKLAREPRSNRFSRPSTPRLVVKGQGDRLRTRGGPQPNNPVPDSQFEMIPISRRWGGMLVLLQLAMAAAMAAAATTPGIGVNWGTVASHRLPSRTVVELLKSNGISKVKLFDADTAVLSSFSGSDIELMVGIPNELLDTIASSSDAAAEWVRLNVTRYTAKNVNIRYVAVGNEPFLQGYSGKYQASTYAALRNIQQAIVAAGLADRVKVTVPFNADVLSDLVTLPSGGVFRADVAAEVGKIVELLADNSSPFTMNIYPFLDLVQDVHFPQDFAYFSGTTHPVVDGKIIYSNVFDASHDLLVSALSRLGYPNLPIIIGEIGWPTDGHPKANPSDAQIFMQGLVKHVTSSIGTPLRPGSPIQTYIFSLFDEDLKSTLPGNFERHWGLFTYDGQAKYSLDLGTDTGTGLVSASKVKYLPSRWCILDTSVLSTNDVSAAKLGDNVDFACSHADCTSLMFGSSCNGMGVDGNASYAFNSYFQLNDQVDGSCYFDGLATVTMQMPTAGNCKFEVQIDTRYNGSRATGTPRAVVATISGGAYSTSARTCMSMLVLPLLHVVVVVLPLVVLPDLLAR